MRNHTDARHTQLRTSSIRCGTPSGPQFQYMQRPAGGTLITIKTYTMTPELPTPRRSNEVQGRRSIPGYCMLTCSVVRTTQSARGSPRFKDITLSLMNYQRITRRAGALNTSHSPSTDLTHISWRSCVGLQRYIVREIMDFS